MKNKIYPFMAALAMMFLVACTNQPKETVCDGLSSIVQDKVGKLFRLEAPSHLNTFKIGDPISVIADNFSSMQIEVAPDSNLKIYWLQGDSWVAVENKANYLGAIERILPKTNSEPGRSTYFIDVDVSGKESSQICVVLEGIYDPDGSRSKVVAITELMLNP